MLDGFKGERVRIGLNLLHVRPEVGGGWQYIEAIVELLQGSDSGNEYVAYCNPISQRMVSRAGNITVRVARGIGTNQLARIAYENTTLQYHAWKDRLDLMHWFANTRAILTAVPSAVTVHDLLAFEQEDAYGAFRRLYARVMIPLSARKAEALLPISSSTSSALQRLFGVPSDKMFVIHYPLMEKWARASEERCVAFRERYRLPRQFWVYVAHFYPHKNHRALIEAYARVKASSAGAWPLVLRGDERPGGVSVKELAAEFGVADSLICLPPLDSDEMPLLYSSAAALVFPSMFEGLGIPLVEALACGCPAIASQIPTAIELAGDSVMLFDLANPQALTNAMLAFQQDPEVLRYYSVKGAERAFLYRPDVVAQKLMASYRHASLS